ncbi:glycerate kinase [Peredibacter sp. HCB2-198]|uniref:glycerate kinase type-2 family protein n=1 Tax=Peredibacter sp. HCB2-198 TaxID=3383025 RepID=UPI0038B681E8
MNKAALDAEKIFRAGLARVDSRSMLGQTLTLTGDELSVQGKSFDLRKFKRILVFGVGKASSRMTQGLIDVLGTRISAGLVITKDNHSESLPSHFVQIESSHPVPDERSVHAGQTLYDFCEKATADDLVIGLISGGASALAALPIDGVTLAQKQAKTKELLATGATIQEINKVRKSLSKIKGGKLAKVIAPATSLNLVLSDVLGDDLHTIASGITVPEPGEVGPANLHNLIIGSNRQALAAAEVEAKRLGYKTVILSDQLTGEAKDAARLFASVTNKLEKGVCYLAGGETTVTLKGSGKGGRNQEMALAFLNEMEKRESWPYGVAFLAASTDGTDGPTDAAGAFATKEILEKASGLNIQVYLDRNDSYHFFQQVQGLLKTGPTGTNVCDLQVLIN